MKLLSEWRFSQVACAGLALIGMLGYQVAATQNSVNTQTNLEARPPAPGPIKTSLELLEKSLLKNPDIDRAYHGMSVRLLEMEAIMLILRVFEIDPAAISLKTGVILANDQQTPKSGAEEQFTNQIRGEYNSMLTEAMILKKSGSIEQYQFKKIQVFAMILNKNKGQLSTGESTLLAAELLIDAARLAAQKARLPDVIQPLWPSNQRSRGNQGMTLSKWKSKLQKRFKESSEAAKKYSNTYSQLSQSAEKTLFLATQNDPSLLKELVNLAPKYPWLREELLKLGKNSR